MHFLRSGSKTINSTPVSGILEYTFSVVKNHADRFAFKSGEIVIHHISQ